MFKKFKLIFLSIIFLMACNPRENYPPDRYFDYSGKDACAPPNIGHMLGGDMEGLENNRLTSMHHIASMQGSNCFKHWEFDVTPSANGLVLMHDIWYGFQFTSRLKKEDLPADSLADFLEAFHALDISKPLMIDLKTVTEKDDLLELKDAALAIKNKHDIDVWFITDHISALFMKDACDILGKEFDIMLYFKGGKLCP